MFLLTNLQFNILVNIIGGIGMVIFLITAYIKNKKRFLQAQCLGHLFFMVSEIMTSAWSSIVQEIVSITRNLSVIHNKSSKALNLILIFTGAIVGILVNIIFMKDNPWYGNIIAYLPVIANLEYSIVVIKKNVTVRQIKLAFAVSALLWAINFSYLGIFVSALLNLITSVTSFIAFIKLKNTKEN